MADEKKADVPEESQEPQELFIHITLDTKGLLGVRTNVANSVVKAGMLALAATAKMEVQSKIVKPGFMGRITGRG